MPSALVVAAPASPHNLSCAFCSKALEGGLAPHLCSACQSPQPRLAGETYFAALSAPARFGQDIPTVQRRFYELSRALHPDRFARADARVRQASLERMSFLNEAFNFLKDRSQIREHFFTTFAISCGGGGGLWMMELSERWFEVQEKAELEESLESVVEFETELLHKKDFLADKIVALEGRFDALAAGSPEQRKVLEEIQSLGLSQNTLNSMIRDVQRLKARMGMG
jgi:hypothetical protein